MPQRNEGEADQPAYGSGITAFFKIVSALSLANLALFGYLMLVAQNGGEAVGALVVPGIIAAFVGAGCGVAIASGNFKRPWWIVGMLANVTLMLIYGTVCVMVFSRTL